MKRRFTLATALVIVAAGISMACATGRSSTVATAPRTSDVTTPSSGEPETVVGARTGSIPVGQEMDVRLGTILSSESSTVEQRFEATTVADLVQDGWVLVPAGAVVSGVVSGVQKAGRIERSGSLTLAFDRLSLGGRRYDIRASATQVFESGGIREEAGTVGVGAGVGGVVGGLLGGFKGAILGAVIGAGGAIAATDGKDIALPAGSIVRIRMDTPVQIS
jgi:hypothetical protein